MDNIKHIVALSGGKDSTAMSLRLKELHPFRNYEFVVTPTGDELPPMKDHWKRLKRILGNLTKLNGQTLFECIREQNMVPNFWARFCTRILKIEPFIDFMESLPENSIMYVGLRADEQDRLGIIRPDCKFQIKYPMREWCWGLQEVLNYLDSKNIKIPERTDCGACFFQRLPEWKNLLEKYPERYERYVQLEKKMGHTFRTPGKDTWPTSLEDLRTEILSGRKMRKTKARNQRCRFCSM
jgi:3'-phosphoadenosine 5'-phosphosulfate sulfotransferase (PAPS reductase)/FAD synthetase